MTNGKGYYLEYKKNSHASLRLFCFHHSGGGATTYFPWVEHLSSNIELVAVQLPGRENRFTEPLNNDLSQIVSQLSDNFFTYQDKPFFVFGHSLGALVAFEFVKSIQKAYSLFPCHMIVSAAKAPHLPFRMKQLSQLDAMALKEELRRYDGIDEQILTNEEVLDLYLPIIRNDFSIYENYKFLESEALLCDILAFSGGDDQTVGLEEIFAWAQYTKGQFEHISFSGKHFFVKNHQREVLRIINEIGNKY